MISEKQFASHYASLWRSLTPAMEEFVRRTNMDGYVREWVPLPATSAPDRRGVINEAAFLLFRDIARKARSEIGVIIKDRINAAFSSAESYVSSTPEDPEHRPTSIEAREITALALRLYSYFEIDSKKSEFLISPPFKGSGVISSCFGDVRIGLSKLIEVKNGDRPFRSIDYRQLITYVALNFGSTGEIINTIVVLNARRGVYSEIGTDVFSRSVSGHSIASLCHLVIEATSASLVSD